MRRFDKRDSPRRVGGLKAEYLDDEVLLYHEQRTRILSLNSTASLIWSLCDGERSLAELEQLLVEAFPDARARIADDLEQAVTSLLGEGVLELQAAPV